MITLEQEKAENNQLGNFPDLGQFPQGLLQKVTFQNDSKFNIMPQENRNSFHLKIMTHYSPKTSQDCKTALTTQY